jgi:hypothetical protein
MNQFLFSVVIFCLGWQLKGQTAVAYHPFNGNANDAKGT